MVALSLKISIGNVVKTMQFEPSTMVYDACRMIRERIPEAVAGPRESDYPGGGGQESSIPYSRLLAHCVLRLLTSQAYAPVSLLLLKSKVMGENNRQRQWCNCLATVAFL